jgi:hypothetical protein
VLRLSKRERVLLHILISIFTLVAAGIYFTIKTEQMISLQQEIDMLERRMQKVTVKSPKDYHLQEKKESLSDRIWIEKEKYYHWDEMDPYQFSIVIRNLVSENGLRIKKYQTIEFSDYTSLEFSISGHILGFIKFLKAVSSADKYWNISFLTLDARKGEDTVDAVFQIHYETVDE